MAMWEAISAYAGVFKWHSGLLVAALIALAMVAMVWRRRGARHTARRINDGRTPAFDRAFEIASRALWFVMIVTLLQEASVILWQMSCKR